MIFFEVNYDIIETRGYNQGDYAEVIYVVQDNWTDKDIKSVEEDSHHLLWDCPVYGKADINDDYEIYFDEYMDNRYKWDRDQFIETFKQSEQVGCV